MNSYVTTIAAALLVLAGALPSTAPAQLTEKERERAEELARIQAKADAAEREKERDRAERKCMAYIRHWDPVNKVCTGK